jgi:GT2 family glycosyltransferase
MTIRSISWRDAMRLQNVSTKEKERNKMSVDVSILIPTCNRVGDAQECLRRISVAISAASHVNCEVIVGNDGAPTDANRISLSNFPCQIRISQGPRKGPASNRNHLAAQSSGELLLFIDDDVKPSPNLITAYATAKLAHPNAEILEGRISRESEPRFAYEEVVENETGGYLWTANLAIHRNAFEKLGGFDSDFPFAAMEDTEFRYRSIKAGIVSVWCPDAVVSHPLTSRKGGLNHARHRYSLLLFLTKYPEYLDTIKRDFTFKQCLRVLKFFIFKRSIIQPLEGYKSVFHRISTILKTRRLLNHPSSISAEMARMESVMNIPPSAKVVI